MELTLASNIIAFPVYPQVVRLLISEGIEHRTFSNDFLKQINDSINSCESEYGYFDEEHLSYVIELLNSCFLPEEIAVFLPYP